jgi:hypothetical protein
MKMQCSALPIETSGFGTAVIANGKAAADAAPDRKFRRVIMG